MPRSQAADERREALRRFKADVFRVLAHPKRIHIVECLRDGERSVTALQESLGIGAPATSQHLAVLRARQLVVARKSGNQVFYSVRDPLLLGVLDTLRRYFDTHIAETLTRHRALRRAGRKA